MNTANWRANLRNDSDYGYLDAGFPELLKTPKNQIILQFHISL